VFSFKGSVAYFACGWNEDSLINVVSKVDLSQAEPLTFDLLTSDYISPSARMFHKLVSVGTHLLMFGGETSDSK
jgi:hypothetical protein